MIAIKAFRRLDLCKGNRVMTKLFLALVASVMLVTSANAWGSRCNPDEAKAQYVCMALLNCRSLHTNYQEIQAITTAEKAADFVDKFFAESSLPEISPLWEQNNEPKFDTSQIIWLKEANRNAVAGMILAANKVILNFKTAPISDYKCQANITFNAELLVAFKGLSTFVQFVGNPIANENFAVAWGILFKKPELFANWLKMQATTLSQCINRNPVYTEGLTFELNEISLCH